MSFSNKVVLITGGSSGIGACAAVMFTQKQAKVAIVGRSKLKLSNIADECEKYGRKPLVIVADVIKDAERIVEETIAAFGQLDVLINNAGILRPGCIFDGNLLNAYDEVMNINLRSVMEMTVQSAPYLKVTKGNIINISSVGGHRLPPNYPSYMIYCVSKGAVIQFTKGAAVEFAPFGVRVNAISPGPVRTNLLENSDFPGSWDDLGLSTALGKVAEPVEIGELLLFLASDKAKSITGSIYLNDNGLLLK